MIGTVILYFVFFCFCSIYLEIFGSELYCIFNMSHSVDLLYKWIYNICILSLSHCAHLSVETHCGICNIYIYNPCGMPRSFWKDSLSSSPHHFVNTVSSIMLIRRSSLLFWRCSDPLTGYFYQLQGLFFNRISSASKLNFVIYWETFFWNRSISNQESEFTSCFVFYT